MSLSAGAKIAVYEIVDALGAGPSTRARIAIC
jgi:hypothetical protein